MFTFKMELFDDNADVKQTVNAHSLTHWSIEWTMVLKLNTRMDNNLFDKAQTQGING